jgi:hypothetical protein
MRVSARPGPSARTSGRERIGHPEAGFSLLEVVVAAALLLLTVTATTACVTAVSRAGQRLEGEMAADRALASVTARLRCLPFCPSALPAPAAECGPGASDLVSAVFPHARADGGTEEGYFVAVSEDGIPAGSFVTSLSADGVRIVCVARFRDAAGGWLGPDDLAGFDVHTAGRVPAAALALDLRATASGGPRSFRFDSRAGAGGELDPQEVPG